jgi:hypothetical protein
MRRKEREKERKRDRAIAQTGDGASWREGELAMRRVGENIIAYLRKGNNILQQ